MRCQCCNSGGGELIAARAITGRYDTVQFLNGWGETVANINQRVIADHPSGQFAVCLKGSTVAVPPDARRIDLPVRTCVCSHGSNSDRPGAKDLQIGPDGSLTIYVQADQPSDSAAVANWLPAPKGDFSLYIRAYWPEEAITSGRWQPPAVQRLT